MTHRLEHRIEWLDGLRGIAVLMVVWYHAYLVGQWVPDIPAFGHYYNLEEMPGTGFIGVELFFFISGFVLFYPYARNLFEGKALDDLPTFGWRRFIKIVPSYVFILLVLVLFGGIQLHSGSELAWVLAVHLGFVLNLLPVHPFGQINAVLWSLSVEVQFYLIFPLLARVFQRYPLATWLAACLIACAYRLATIPYVDRYPVLLPQLPAYIDLFAAGMFAAYWCVRLRVQLKPTRWLTQVATLGAFAGVFLTVVLLGALWDSRMHSDWRENWSILGRFGLSLGFIAIALGSTFGARWWRKALGNPVLVFFSIISYNVYLWHHFIFVMMGRSLGAIMAPMPLTLAITIAGFGCGTFFTYFLERPLLRLAPPWKRDAAKPALVPAQVEVPRPGA